VEGHDQGHVCTVKLDHLRLASLALDRNEGPHALLRNDLHERLGVSDDEAVPRVGRYDRDVTLPTDSALVADDDGDLASKHSNDLVPVVMVDEPPIGRGQGPLNE
jgi:hypothetical protein